MASQIWTIRLQPDSFPEALSLPPSSWLCPGWAQDGDRADSSEQVSGVESHGDLGGGVKPHGVAFIAGESPGDGDSKAL